MDFYETAPVHDLTYSDVFLIPSRSAVASRFAVQLAPADGTGASIPLVAANMNSVTGPLLAATLARRGGLGVLPQDMTLAEVQAAISWVKAQPIVFDPIIELHASDSVRHALRRLPPVAGRGITVRAADGAYLGVVSAESLGKGSVDRRLGDLLGGQHFTLTTEDISDDASGAREAFDRLTVAGVEFAPVLERGSIVGTVSRASAVRSGLYHPTLDSDGRLSVAAAIGINGNPGEKAQARVDAGANVIVIDTAHGHQEAMVRAIEAVTKRDLGVPIVAGNVVTSAAVRDLVSAGATIVKVGVGPGAMCTTRMMTAVGRPQFSAVLETAATARELGAQVWADGGVRYPRDVALALAAGAASVMIGSWFAGTIESPGEILTDQEGRLYKESWGMASTKAVSERFARLDAYERARKTLFAEGISSSTVYLDPLRPSVEDLIDTITAGLRSSLSYAGATSLSEFHDRALVGIQSAAGYEEGKALPVGW